MNSRKNIMIFLVLYYKVSRYSTIFVFSLSGNGRKANWNTHFHKKNVRVFDLVKNVKKRQLAK